MWVRLPADARELLHEDYQKVQTALKEAFSFRSFDVDKDEFEYLGATVTRRLDGTYHVSHTE